THKSTCASCLWWGVWVVPSAWASVLGGGCSWVEHWLLQKFPCCRWWCLLCAGAVVVGGTLLGSRATSRLFVGVVGCWVRPAWWSPVVGGPGVGSSVA